MNRYTYMENEHWRVKIGEQEIRAGFVDRLADYENLDLEPEEIKRRLEEYRAYRHVCDGRSPVEVELAIRTRAGYKRYRSEAWDILEEAIDTLAEVGNGVTDEMLYELLQKIFILRDIVQNKIGQERDSNVEECAEYAKRVLHKDGWEEAKLLLPNDDTTGGEGGNG